MKTKKAHITSEDVIIIILALGIMGATIWILVKAIA
jgi:hypothetical protein